jgi:hypothetical protein
MIMLLLGSLFKYFLRISLCLYLIRIRNWPLSTKLSCLVQTIFSNVAMLCGHYFLHFCSFIYNTLLNPWSKWHELVHHKYCFHHVALFTNIIILSLKLVVEVLFWCCGEKKRHIVWAAGIVSINKRMHDPLVEASNYMSLNNFDLLATIYLVQF